MSVCVCLKHRTHGAFNVAAIVVYRHPNTTTIAPSLPLTPNPHETNRCSLTC